MIKLAALGLESIIGNVKHNLEITISWIERLSKQGVNFILFPELNLSGYTKNTDVLEKILAQKEATFKELIKISQNVNNSFAVGFPEKEAGKYYISHFLFSNGKLLGSHRKTHLSPSEKEVYEEGNKMDVFEVGALKIGMQLCFETHFPEISYAQAQQGANVLAMAFASPHENSETKLERFKRFLSARAYDNNCLVMACNLDGETDNGIGIPPMALILNPKGEVLNQTTQGCCIINADLGQIEKIRQSHMGNFNIRKRVNLFQKFYAEKEDEMNEGDEFKII